MIIEEKKKNLSGLGDTVMTLEGISDINTIPLVVSAGAYYYGKKKREKKRKAEEERRRRLEAERLEKERIKAEEEQKRVKFLDLLARWVTGRYHSNPEFSGSDTWKVRYYKIAYNIKTGKRAFFPAGDRYASMLKDLINKYRGVKSKFISAPPKAKKVDKKFISAARSFSREQRKKIRDNIFKLNSEIEQLRKTESELKSRIIDAQAMNDVATGRKLAPLLLKVTKGIANKMIRLNLYKQQEKYVDKFEEAVEKGDVNSIIANQAGVKLTGEYINKFKNVAKYLGNKDELEMKKAEIQSIEQEKEQLTVMSNYDPEAHNTLIALEEREKELQKDVDLLENEVISEEKDISSDPIAKELIEEDAESGLSELAINISEFSEFAGVDDLSDLSGFFDKLWNTTKKIASVPVKAAKWVGNKTVSAAKWVAGSAGKIAGSALGPVMSSIFGGGGAPSGSEIVPVSTDTTQQSNGLFSNKTLLISGGVAGLILIYFLTKKK